MPNRSSLSEQNDYRDFTKMTNRRKCTERNCPMVKQRQKQLKAQTDTLDRSALQVK